MGYLVFVKFPNMDILPTPPMIQSLANDPELKADMLEDVKAARQRSADLIKLAAHSFDVTLGALLGFFPRSRRVSLNEHTRSGATRRVERIERNQSARLV